MSVSAAEIAKLRRDFDLANKQGWDNALSDEAKRIQAANPGMSFDAAWNRATLLHPELVRVDASGAFQKTAR